MDRKKVIIHDLPQDIANSKLGFLSPEYIIIDANVKAAKCVGCFDCWLKNPGVCTFSDELEKIGQIVLSSSKLIIVTQMLYGGVSIPVKKVLDRSIPGVTPFFIKKAGFLHHYPRYNCETEIKAIFYNAGNISENSRKQAQQYITAMGTNFHSKHSEVQYVNDTDLREVVF